ncbi:hypothetical protein [Aquimarina algiphila]|uniref:Uncharacterized protein n=1 Tax=Aquimarina algiphila TaxID=2047982 RepID=A0A554VPL5_9FLAO|nr:hypothetical protein [Aquimarina algiphila]TSE10414.1 hypothetical protein FOF46_05095 [Aquimarina algiphila]
MNSENTMKSVEQKKIHLSLSLGSINQILAALGSMPYIQVYELIQNIKVQTELALNDHKVQSDKEMNEYEHKTANS